MNDSEKWVNEVMKSFDGMQRATPRVDLFDSIKEQITTIQPIQIIPTRKLAWIAVAACTLMLINVYALTTSSHTQNTENQPTEIIRLFDYSLY